MIVIWHLRDWSVLIDLHPSNYITETGVLGTEAGSFGIKTVTSNRLPNRFVTIV